MRYLTNSDFMTKDCVDGLALIYPDLVQNLPDSFNGRAALRSPLDPTRVNLIISAGGAGGPFSQAFVTSPDLADVGVNGAPHAAPSAYDIYEAAKAINSPHGYLLMCNNFMGDTLNNDLAAELLELEGYKARMVTFRDDMLSVAPDAPREERTGLIGGISYGVKVAASAARQGATLDELVDLVEHMNDRMSSVTLTFDFEKELLMLGEGISGEPARIIHENSFTLEDAARISFDLLYDDLKPQPGEKLYLHINRMYPSHYEDTFALAKFLHNYAAFW